MRLRFNYLWVLLVINVYGEDARNPLQHVRTDNPRDTMQSFMSAMEDYSQGLRLDNALLQDRIDDAVRTLNLEEYPRLLQKEKGRETAILLKEVIDRIIVIDYDLIPGAAEPGGTPLLRWRLKNTEISITRVDQGERQGEYLFSKDTVFRSREFYEKVKDLAYLPESGQGAGYRTPWYVKRIPDWTRAKFLNIAIWQWLGFLVVLAAGFLVNLLMRLFFSRLVRLAARSRTEWDDGLFKSTRSPVALLAACGVWYAGVSSLQLAGAGLAVLNVLLGLVFSLAVIWLVYNVVDVSANNWILGNRKSPRTADEHLLHMLKKVLKFIVVLFGVLVVLQSYSINVISVVAGLGLGGLAVALAAKDAVANFFGSVMILVDRPFMMGDWIVVGQAEGTVEEVGFRSTRIRTFYDSVITIPNSELMNAKIDNMGRREHRRIKTGLKINLNTPPEKITRFVDGIRKIITESPLVCKGNVQVAFYEFGPDYLEVLLSFFLDVPDYLNELDERQRIFLQVINLATELQVEFAVPMRALLQRSAPPETKAPLT